MTYLDFIFIGILVIGSAIAAAQGLIKTVFGFASTLVAMIFAYLFYPVLGEFFINNTGIYDAIQLKIVEALDLEELARQVISSSDGVNMIENLALPDFLKQVLLENSNMEVYKLLGVDGVHQIGDYVSRFLATMAINALSFILLFILAVIIIGLLAHLLDLIAKLPVLKQINHIAGFAVGLVLSMLLLWVISLVLFFATSLQGTTELQLLIEQSPFVQIFYENNLLLDTLTDVTKTWLG